jgi:hypothetical protein
MFDVCVFDVCVCIFFWQIKMECTVKYENDTFSVKIAIKTEECIALCAKLNWSFLIVYKWQFRKSTMCSAMYNS